jgi:hypothetical protein
VVTIVDTIPNDQSDCANDESAKKNEVPVFQKSFHRCVCLIVKIKVENSTQRKKWNPKHIGTFRWCPTRVSLWGNTVRCPLRETQEENSRKNYG